MVISTHYNPKKNIIRICFRMALDVTVWLIIGLAGVIAYILGLHYKTPMLFFLGCSIIIGAGALLWGFDGLDLGRNIVSISDSGIISYESVVVTMENVGLTMLSLMLVSVGVLSAFIFTFNEQKLERGSAFYF